MWILFFVQVLLTSATGQPYFISNEMSSSSAAATMCKLAAPLIQFTQDGQEVDLTNTNIGAIPESMWVGYVMIYTTFVYKGCALVNSDEMFFSSSNIRADPGHCYSFCGTKYIGIERSIQNNETTCYCFTSLPSDLLQRHCTVACTFPIGTICGGISGRLMTFVSVYEKVSEPQTQTFPGDIDGRCLAFEPFINRQLFFWSSCNNAFGSICQNGYGNVIHTDGRYADWQDTMMECIQSYRFPVNSNTNLSSVQDYSQLWIGAIRSYSMQYLSEDIVHTDSYLQGYIDTRWKLHFINLTDSLRLQSLCLNSSSSISTLGTDSAMQPSSLTTAIFSPVNTQPSTPSTPRASGGRKTSQSDESNGGLIALYIVVPLVAIAITVAVGVLIRRRRRQTTKESTDAPYYINGVQQTEPDTTYINDVDLNPYESSHHVDSTEHQYSALDHRRENATVTYTNVDHTYTNQQNSSENVYENK